MPFPLPERRPQPGLELPGFEEFHREYAPWVRRGLVWLEEDRRVVDDAVQGTMLKAYQYWERVTELTDPRGWLVRVARQQLCDARAQHWNRDVPMDPATLRARLAAPDPILAADDRLDVLAAIRKLPTRQQEAIVLRWQYGLRYKQIAEIMGASPATIRAHVHQGRMTLEGILADPVEEEDTGA
ncbi:RNA polymerase sigma factor [Streptomyces melanogenes]|uniref:RNA polymerase sigma factor n=1 Tax=Streptomyces melanogenes TaxID=67326 RepID=UPI00379E2B6C